MFVIYTHGREIKRRIEYAILANKGKRFVVRMHIYVFICVIVFVSMYMLKGSSICIEHRHTLSAIV